MRGGRWRRHAAGDSQCSVDTRRRHTHVRLFHARIWTVQQAERPPHMMTKTEPGRPNDMNTASNNNNNNNNISNKKHMKNGLYVHSSPPKTLANESGPGSAKIREYIRSADVDSLEDIILQGQGAKLVNQHATDQKVRAFLKTVPSYMSKIDLIHDAVEKGDLRELKALLDKRKLASCKDAQGVGILHKAVLHAHRDIVDYLIEDYPETLDVTDNKAALAEEVARILDADPKFPKAPPSDPATSSDAPTRTPAVLPTPAQIPTPASTTAPAKAPTPRRENESGKQLVRDSALGAMSRIEDTSGVGGGVEGAGSVDVGREVDVKGVGGVDVGRVEGVGGTVTFPEIVRLGTGPGMELADWSGAIPTGCYSTRTPRRNQQQQREMSQVQQPPQEQPPQEHQPEEQQPEEQQTQEQQRQQQELDSEDEEDDTVFSPELSLSISQMLSRGRSGRLPRLASPPPSPSSASTHLPENLPPVDHIQSVDSSTVEPRPSSLTSSAFLQHMERVGSHRPLTRSSLSRHRRLPDIVPRHQRDRMNSGSPRPSTPTPTPKKLSASPTRLMNNWRRRAGNHVSKIISSEEVEERLNTALSRIKDSDSEPDSDGVGGRRTYESFISATPPPGLSSGEERPPALANHHLTNSPPPTHTVLNTHTLLPPSNSPPINSPPPVHSSPPMETIGESPTPVLTPTCISLGPESRESSPIDTARISQSRADQTDRDFLEDNSRGDYTENLFGDHSISIQTESSVLKDHSGDDYTENLMGDISRGIQTERSFLEEGNIHDEKIKKPENISDEYPKDVSDGSTKHSSDGHPKDASDGHPSDTSGQPAQILSTKAQKLKSTTKGIPAGHTKGKTPQEDPAILRSSTHTEAATRPEERTLAEHPANQNQSTGLTLPSDTRTVEKKNSITEKYFGSPPERRATVSQTQVDELSNNLLRHFADQDLLVQDISNKEPRNSEPETLELDTRLEKSEVHEIEATVSHFTDRPLAVVDFTVDKSESPEVKALVTLLTVSDPAAEPSHSIVHTDKPKVLKTVRIVTPGPSNLEDHDVNYDLQLESYSKASPTIQRYIRWLSSRIIAECFANLKHVYATSIKRHEDIKEVWNIVYDHDIAYWAKVIVDRVLEKVINFLIEIEKEGNELWEVLKHGPLDGNSYIIEKEESKTGKPFKSQGITETSDDEDKAVIGISLNGTGNGSPQADDCVMEPLHQKVQVLTDTTPAENRNLHRHVKSSNNSSSKLRTRTVTPKPSAVHLRSLSNLSFEDLESITSVPVDKPFTETSGKGPDTPKRTTRVFRSKSSQPLQRDERKAVAASRSRSSGAPGQPRTQTDTVRTLKSKTTVAFADFVAASSMCISRKSPEADTSRSDMNEALVDSKCRNPESFDFRIQSSKGLLSPSQTPKTPSVQVESEDRLSRSSSTRSGRRLRTPQDSESRPPSFIKESVRREMMGFSRLALTPQRVESPSVVVRESKPKNMMDFGRQSLIESESWVKSSKETPRSIRNQRNKIIKESKGPTKMDLRKQSSADSKNRSKAKNQKLVDRVEIKEPNLKATSVDSEHKDSLVISETKLSDNMDKPINQLNTLKSISEFQESIAKSKVRDKSTIKESKPRQRISIGQKSPDGFTVNLRTMFATPVSREPSFEAERQSSSPPQLPSDNMDKTVNQLNTLKSIIEFQESIAKSKARDKSTIKESKPRQRISVGQKSPDGFTMNLRTMFATPVSREPSFEAERQSSSPLKLPSDNMDKTVNQLNTLKSIIEFQESIAKSKVRDKSTIKESTPRQRISIGQKSPDGFTMNLRTMFATPVSREPSFEAERQSSSPPQLPSAPQSPRSPADLFLEDLDRLFGTPDTVSFLAETDYAVGDNNTVEISCAGEDSRRHKMPPKLQKEAMSAKSPKDTASAKSRKDTLSANSRTSLNVRLLSSSADDSGHGSSETILNTNAIELTPIGKTSDKIKIPVNPLTQDPPAHTTHNQQNFQPRLKKTLSTRNLLSLNQSTEDLRNFDESISGSSLELQSLFRSSVFNLSGLRSSSRSSSPTFGELQTLTHYPSSGIIERAVSPPPN
nr:uncharacterized protein LOC123770450 [Procambarus clarkii]